MFLRCSLKFAKWNDDVITCCIGDLIVDFLDSLKVQKTIQTIVIDLRGVGMSKEVLKWCKNVIFSSKKLKISYQNLDKHGWKNLIVVITKNI